MSRGLFKKQYWLVTKWVYSINFRFRSSNNALLFTIKNTSCPGKPIRSQNVVNNHWFAYFAEPREGPETRPRLCSLVDSGAGPQVSRRRRPWANQAWLHRRLGISLVCLIQLPYLSSRQVKFRQRELQREVHPITLHVIRNPAYVMGKKRPMYFFGECE